MLLAIAIALLGLSWLASVKKWGRAEAASRILFFVTLGTWFWQQSDFLNLGSGEAGLLKWIGYALMLALVGEILQVLAMPGKISQAIVPVTAILLAMGLDVFRPSEYAYSPATVLAILVLLLGVRAAQRMLRDLKGSDNSGQRTSVLIHIVSIGLLLFAAAYKLMDRNWLLPWSYLITIGALLFAVAQLWIAWDELFGKEVVSARNARAAYQLGILFLAVSALFHYQQYF